MAYFGRMTLKQWRDLHPSKPSKRTPLVRKPKRPIDKYLCTYVDPDGKTKKLRLQAYTKSEARAMMKKVFQDNHGVSKLPMTLEKKG